MANQNRHSSNGKVWALGSRSKRAETPAAWLWDRRQSGYVVLPNWPNGQPNGQLLCYCLWRHPQIKPLLELCDPSVAKVVQCKATARWLLDVPLTAARDTEAGPEWQLQWIHRHSYKKWLQCISSFCGNNVRKTTIPHTRGSFPLGDNFDQPAYFCYFLCWSSIIARTLQYWCSWVIS